MHIGKTGGTAIKRTLHGARLAHRREGGERLITPTKKYGFIKLQPHAFTMADLPDGEHVFFSVRDPIGRFLSGFSTRIAKGGTTYGSRFAWTPEEEIAFSRFHTPEQLGLALGSDDEDEREAAGFAMRNIIHLGYQRRYTGTIGELRDRLDQVVYIAKQETLDDDWKCLKRLLQLPRDLELITDPQLAHRRVGETDPELDPAAVRNLREWYARDYALMAAIDKIRDEHGWGPQRRTRRMVKQMRRSAGRARRRVVGRR